MVVEEVLHGPRLDQRKVEVNSLAGSSCYMRLQEGETYVIYGSRDDNLPELIHRHACSFSFNVRGSEFLLEALRRAATGQPPVLVGRLYKKTDRYGPGSRAGPGIRVSVEQNGKRLETTTTDDGQFIFEGITSGHWRLQVDTPGLVYLSKEDWPKKSLRIPASGCEERFISVAAIGRISGTVVDSEDKPVQGVPVQIFTVNLKGEIDNLPYLEAGTDKNGKYDLQPLPAARYVVAVNGEEFHDRFAFPPAFYAGARRREDATVIELGEAQQNDGVNLILAAPRKPAILRIEPVYEDGRPVLGAVAKALDPAGVSRAFVHGDEKGKGLIRFELWIGETFVVDVYNAEVRSSQVDEWKGKSEPVQLSSSETRVRVVLKKVTK